MIRFPILPLLALLSLGGCSALSAIGGATAPLDAYEVRAPNVASAGRTRGLDVIIELPVASGAIATDRILIRPSATEVAYLPGARWTEPAPEMMQSALVAGLESAGAFRYVGRRPLGSSGDIAVVSNLDTFHAETVADSPSAVIRVKLIGRLVRERDAAVIGTRTFSASATAADTEAESVVAAYNAAAGEVIDAMLKWIVAARGV